MQKIPTYVINLARREDRLASISSHLKVRGVEFARIDAIDYKTLDPAIVGRILQSNAALHYMGIGEWCCLFSHMKAWRSFLESPHKAGLFLEDDIYLSVDIAQLLADDNWLQKDVHIIKLDQWKEITPECTRILLSKPLTNLPIKRSLHKMGSTYLDGGAYILSRKGAKEALLAAETTRVSVDYMLFAPSYSRFARKHARGIIDPCMAVHKTPHSSDLDPLRVQKAASGRQKKTLTWFRQKIMQKLITIYRRPFEKLTSFFTQMHYHTPVFEEDMGGNEKPDSSDNKEKP